MVGKGGGRQIRSRTTVCLWQGAARMSLATWGGEDIDMEDIDNDINKTKISGKEELS